MIKVLPFATALAAVMAAFYLLCALLALLVPDFLLALFQSWFHGLDLAKLAPDGALVTLPRFIIGLVSLTLVTWFFAAGWATLYNTLAGSREARE